MISYQFSKKIDVTFKLISSPSSGGIDIFMRKLLNLIRLPNHYLTTCQVSIQGNLMKSFCKHRCCQSRENFSSKLANICLNVRERVEVVEWNKNGSSFPLLFCESPVRLKENPDKKKKGSIAILKKVTLTCGDIKLDKNF